MKRRSEISARLMRRRALLEARKVRTLAQRVHCSRFYAIAERRQRRRDRESAADRGREMLWGLGI